jgi:hypothetical protein
LVYTLLVLLSVPKLIAALIYGDTSPRLLVACALFVVGASGLVSEHARRSRRRPPRAIVRRRS